MSFTRRNILFFALGICALSAIADASAQVRVDLSLRRPYFIRYEPIIATVTITNMTGRNLDLANAEEDNHKWFSFHIENTSGELIPPYNPDYQLSPVSIGAGESIKRTVNITPLYPLTEFGTYRVRATVYDSKTGQYYSSNPPINIEITEGRVLWEQSVGVPEGAPGEPGTRTVTLLSHRLPDDTQLYLRIEDKDKGLVYCTSQLGRIVSFGKPDIEIDAHNEINILQNFAPKMFLYTRAALNGQILERKQYAGMDRSQPSLQHDASGGFQVAGGLYIDPAAAAAQRAASPPPSVSARPVPLPKPE